MKFLKTAIVVLFVLSLLTAALGLYLANVRENEKEKRIYLESVKSELEDRVVKLEKEKVDLTKQVTRLESEQKAMEDKLVTEQKAREEAVALVQKREADLAAVQNDAQQAQIAFQEAQKRNQELERILDELEGRMRQIENQSQLPGSEVGYIEVQPSRHKEETKKLESKAAEIKEQVPDVSFKPVTSLPEPPKKRKFLSFLRSGDQAESETKPVESVSKKDETEAMIIPAPEPFPVKPAVAAYAPQPLESEALQTPNVSAPELIKETPRIQRTEQAIAGGNVLLVNRKYNFVVVNLGSQQNLELNDTLSIYREGKEIAKARVEKLYDDYSAAYIIEEQSDHPITEGDTVAKS